MINTFYRIVHQLNFSASNTLCDSDAAIFLFRMASESTGESLHSQITGMNKHSFQVQEDEAVVC